MPVKRQRHLKAKVCLVGDEAVGKSSVIRRFVHNQFEGDYLRTIGTQVSKKEVVLPAEGVAMTLMVWDIMGRKGFLDLITAAYFYRASGVLAVCDAARASTLQGLETWLMAVEENLGKVPMVILGNKSDLVTDRPAAERALRALAQGHGAQWFLTSAKTGENVNRAFEVLAGLVTTRVAPVTVPAAH